MNAALHPFAFEDALVRIHTDGNGDPWFVAKDVCRVLEIGNHRDAVSQLEEDEKDGVGITDSIGREQQITVISESGLYALIFRSRKPAARRFRKWVTSEVLPAIRKTGGYMPPCAPAAALPLSLQLPEETLSLRPFMREKLWADAMQAARLDNAGTDAAVRWFAALCRMVAEKPVAVLDEVREFFQECCLYAPGKREKVSALYEAFRVWRSGTSRSMPSMKAFSQSMSHFARPAKSNVMVFRDIALRREA